MRNLTFGVNYTNYIKMSNKPVLYSYFRSSASWRVRVALAMKGIEYEYKPIHLVKGEQRSDEYKTLNPMCQLPTLLIDGLKLTQSLPIIEYLDETRPENKLIPEDPVKRYQARKIAEIINSGIQPLQNFAILVKVSELVGDPNYKAKFANEVITKGLEGLEPALKETAGKYCVGDTVTIADLALVPQVYNAYRFNVDMTKFPTADRVNNALVELDAFKAADPKNQPDFPEELK